MNGDHMPSLSFDFHEIHESYRARITRFMAGLAGENEAEDLCQEVFSKVAKGLKKFRADSELSTWIYRIATNTYLDYVRSRSCKDHRKELLTPNEQIDAVTENIQSMDRCQATLDQQIIRDEMIECIREYINQLPEDYRIVLLLSEEEGFKNGEIADILNISLDNVKIRLHRARTKLKENLQENCDFYLDDRSEIACDRKQDCD